MVDDDFEEAELYDDLPLTDSEEQLRTVLNKLREQGAVQVVVSYSGHGDEGEIYDIHVLNDKNQELKLSQQEWNALVEFTYEQVPSGWDQENGSRGDLDINLLTWQAELKHEWCVETYEEDFEEVELPPNNVTDGSDPNGK